MPIRLAAPASGTYAYPLLIKQLLHTSLATSPQQEIVYRDLHRYTYRDFRGRLGQLANMLTSLGGEAGITIAVMDWDSHRYLECFFAIPMMGAVLQTVNVRLSPQEILYTLKDTGAQIVLVNRDFVPLLDSIRAQLPDLRVVILMDDAPLKTERPDWIHAEYEDVLAKAPAAFEFQEFDEHAVATTFHTTGTTGLPKAVSFSHRQIVLLSLAALGTIATPQYGQCFRHGDVYMPMTPMFHVHAWIMPYVATLMGVKQVYPGRYIPSELLALRAREKVTFSHCVPTILRMLLKDPSAAGANFSGWKVVIGGAALPAALAVEALNAGMDVFAGYGMSETAPTLTMARLQIPPGTPPSDLELAQRCSAGLPLPLVDLQIMDANMQPQPRDGRSVGEIVVRTPWTTAGYVGNPQASEALWHGGYLHTQDIGFMDESGYLHITDRIKDVIKSGGEWVSSLQLEEIISQHPAVAEVAVIAVPDPQWTERPNALVVVRPQYLNSVRPEDIKAFVTEQVTRAGLSKFSIPDRIIIVEALEKTSVGKFNKRLMRERYGSN